MTESRRLASSTRIALEHPRDVLDRLCDHLAEHVPVERGDGEATLTSDFGVAHAAIEDGALSISLESGDETGLSFLRLMMAEHVLTFAGDPTPAISWSGDGKAGAPLPYFREMRVVSVASVTPLMRRIVLAGPDLARFTTGGLHVRLLFPPAGIAVPQWPVNGEDGRPRWPDADARPAARVYTIRHIDTDRGEIAIDMVLHDDPGGDHAPGAGFAQDARPGDIVGMTGPGGGSIGEASRYILLGDETALPAIARLLESMPEGAEVAAFVEVADAREEQPLTSPASLSINWLHRNGAPAGVGDRLASAVREHRWLAEDGDAPFVWAGCEHAQARAIRRFVQKEAGLARDKCHVVAYWRRGAAGDEARKD